MKIVIKVIPSRKQRYKTSGDWIEKDGNWFIYISDTGSWRKNFLIALHEQIEMALCKFKKIKGDLVDKFDISYHGKDPGRSKKAPYHKQHVFADKIEQMIAKKLKVKRSTY